MILEAIFDFGIWLFGLIAETFPSMQPVTYSAVNSLETVLRFGVWVIGEDMWNFFISTVTGWLTFKMGWGVVLFVYRLIPLT